MKQLLSILLLISLLVLPSCKKAHLNEQTDKKKTKIIESKEEKDKEFMSTLAKEELEGFLKDTTNNLLRGKILINNDEELIQFAEPILFRVYGKMNILLQRPYEIYLFDDYWYMMGTLSSNFAKGGTFSIAVNRKTCEVVGISHDK